MVKTRNAGTENPMFGKKHSPEALMKMSVAHRGKKRPPRSEEWRKNISASHKGLHAGAKNPSWRGGKKKDRGYILIHKPGHPFVNGQGYVYEHRLVMEAHLGRYLRPEETPHHINENKSDNRIENLQLFDGHGRHSLEARHIVHGEDGRFVGKKTAGCLLDGKEHKETPL